MFTVCCVHVSVYYSINTVFTMCCVHVSMDQCCVHISVDQCHVHRVLCSCFSGSTLCSCFSGSKPSSQCAVFMFQWINIVFAVHPYPQPPTATERQ